MNDVSRETKLNGAFVKLADTLIDTYDVVDLLHTLVERCTEILDTQAGGIMLADAVGVLQLIASTSEEANLVEIMQLDAGAGPCVDCFTSGSPVTVGDIGESGSRWPAFRDAALSQGFRSVHATPLRLRGRILGTMNLFSTRVGELRSEDVTVAQALADVATIGILQERSIRDAADVSAQLQHALDTRVVIEQAKGVVAESARMTIHEAFVAMRHYARDHNQSLKGVAESVIARSIDIGAYSASRVRK